MSVQEAAGYVKIHNSHFIHPNALKVSQEFENFLCYNFGSQLRDQFLEKGSRKIQLPLLWFSCFSENRASVFRA